MNARWRARHFALLSRMTPDFGYSHTPRPYLSSNVWLKFSTKPTAITAPLICAPVFYAQDTTRRPSVIFIPNSWNSLALTYRSIPFQRGYTMVISHPYRSKLSQRQRSSLLTGLRAIKIISESIVTSSDQHSRPIGVASNDSNQIRLAQTLNTEREVKCYLCNGRSNRFGIWNA